MASLKPKIDQIDVDKLNTVPVDWSKLSNVVNDKVVKKTVYDKLVAEVNNINVSGFVLKTKYYTDKSNLEKKISEWCRQKIPNISVLVKKNYGIITDYGNAKITEIESKISSIFSLATTAALTTAENKIPDVSNLVRKSIYDAKISLNLSVLL